MYCLIVLIWKSVKWWGAFVVICVSSSVLINEKRHNNLICQVIFIWIRSPLQGGKRKDFFFLVQYSSKLLYHYYLQCLAAINWQHILRQLWWWVTSALFTKIYVTWVTHMAKMIQVINYTNESFDAAGTITWCKLQLLFVIINC